MRKITIKHFSRILCTRNFFNFSFKNRSGSRQALKTSFCLRTNKKGGFRHFFTENCFQSFLNARSENVSGREMFVYKSFRNSKNCFSLALSVLELWQFFFRSSSILKWIVDLFFSFWHNLILEQICQIKVPRKWHQFLYISWNTSIHFGLVF